MPTAPYYGDLFLSGRAGDCKLRSDHSGKSIKAVCLNTLLFDSLHSFVIRHLGKCDDELLRDDDGPSDCLFRCGVIPLMANLVVRLIPAEAFFWFDAIVRKPRCQV